MACIAPPWALPPIARPYRSLSLQLPIAQFATAYFFDLTKGANGSPHFHGTLRSVPKDGAVIATVLRPPFVLFGREPSVVLETLKRADLNADGNDGLRTIVLRLYEAFRGHASVGLQINVGRGRRCVEDDPSRGWRGGGGHTGADGRRGGWTSTVLGNGDDQACIPRV